MGDIKQIMDQQTLQLPPNRRKPELGDFVTDDTSVLAVKVVEAMIGGNRQFNPLGLIGGCGVGKTHLLRATRREWLRRFPQTVIRYVTAEKFTNLFIEAVYDKGSKMGKFQRFFRMVDVLLVDELSFFTGKAKTQEEFLQTLDALLARNSQIVFAGNVHPRELNLPEALTSRLLGGLLLTINPLGLVTRRKLLDQLIERSENPSAWPTGVRELVVSRLDGDARTLIGVFNAVEAYQKLLGKGITEELVKEILGRYCNQEAVPCLSLETIETAVEDYFDLYLVRGQLRTKSRAATISHPRQVAMFLARQLIPGLTLTEIGDYFGRDHTTVVNACKVIDGARPEHELKAICSQLKAQWPV
jgi:chromosomal replication initiator protein